MPTVASICGSRALVNAGMLVFVFRLTCMSRFYISVFAQVDTLTYARAWH